MRIAEEQARARFERARAARLATADQRGQPHLVPVTFALRGDEIAVAIDHKPKDTARLKRLRNIEENSRVSLLADHYEDDWTQLWWVRVDGDAGITEAGTRPELVDALAEKYPQYRRNRPDRALIVIGARRWNGWHF